MELVELSIGSEGYEAALRLRYRVLREPLGVEWSDEERAWEEKERHFGLLEGGTVAACASIRPLGEGRVKLRQMAVSPERQGRGVGRLLLERVEERLRNDGVGEIELNARAVALGFYRTLGYDVVGAPFAEVGIPHQKMRKRLG